LRKSWKRRRRYEERFGRSCGAFNKNSAAVYFSAASPDCYSGRASRLCAAGEGFLGSPFAIALETRGLKFDTEATASQHSNSLLSSLPAISSALKKFPSTSGIFRKLDRTVRLKREDEAGQLRLARRVKRIAPHDINRVSSQRGRFPVSRK
jgi:hypothetical protein